MRKIAVFVICLFVFSFTAFLTNIYAQKQEITVKDEKTGEETKVKIDGEKSEITVKKEGEKCEEKVEIEQTKDEVKITQKDEAGKVNEAFEISQNLPKNFRKDIPIYQNAKIIRSVSNSTYQAVTLETEDSHTKVADSFKEEMKKNKWELKDSQESKMGDSDIITLIYTKDDVQLTFSAWVMKEKDRTITQIAINTIKKDIISHQQ